MFYPVKLALLDDEGGNLALTASWDGEDSFVITVESS